MNRVGNGSRQKMAKVDDPPGLLIRQGTVSYPFGVDGDEKKKPVVAREVDSSSQSAVYLDGVRVPAGDAAPGADAISVAAAGADVGSDADAGAGGGGGGCGCGSGGGRGNSGMLVECKDYVRPSLPAAVMEVAESRSVKWVYTNYISRFWCVVVDPTRGGHLYLMVSEGGGPYGGGMRWVGRIMTAAITSDFWPPDQMWESEFGFLVPIRSGACKNGLIQLDLDKMMDCQVRATSKEMIDYAKKLFACTNAPTPDYHLVRPIFHHMLKNVTNWNDRDNMFREFLMSWPNHVRI